jgi:ADP-L-glycero-D-manno-heptose 6-epimerase
VQANILACEPKKSGVYNVGSGEARQFNEVFGNLTDVLEIDVSPEYIDNPWKFYQNHTEADIASTKEGLGYEPRFSLEEGIKAYAPEIKAIYERELAGQ